MDKSQTTAQDLEIDVIVYWFNQLVWNWTYNKDWHLSRHQLNNQIGLFQEKVIPKKINMTSVELADGMMSLPLGTHLICPDEHSMTISSDLHD